MFADWVDAGMAMNRDQDSHPPTESNETREDPVAWEFSTPVSRLGIQDPAMYIGRYFSEELEAFYSIEADAGGTLRMIQRRSRDIPLKKEFRDHYSGSLLIFPLEVQFIRDPNDRVTGFLASTTRTKGVLFIKQ